MLHRNQKKQTTTLIAALTAAWCSPLWAQAALDEVVVSATRSERLIDLSPKSVSVVDRPQIESRPMTNVQSLLDEVPGISYSRAGGLGGQLVVRGLNSNDPRMVLFVDGDRFRGRNTLEYNFLDPNEIERIEIIRGPASALYGSDAMNGVVNVITRRATGDPTQPFSLTPRLYAVGYSSTDALAATRLELQGLGNGFDALIGVNTRSAGNYSTPLGEVPNSNFASQSLNARIGYSPSATQRFEIVGKIGRTQSGRAGGIAGAPGAPLLKLREDPNEERYLRLGYTQSKVATWLHSMEASLYVRDLSTTLRTENRAATNGNVSFSNQYVSGPVVYGGKLLARSAFGDNMLSYGADFYHEDRPGAENDARTVNAAGVTTVVTPRAKRNRDAAQTNVGVFVHNDWDPSQRWTVSLGARYDLIRTAVEGSPALGENAALSGAFAQNLSAQDHAFTGSTGLIFRPADMLYLVGNVSTAFRAPATFEKFGGSVAGAVTTLPNPGLKSESSTSYEVGARLRLQQLNMNVTAFHSDYTDLLQTVALNATTRQRQNTGEATIEGVELDGVYSMTKAIALRFNAANVRGTNTRTNMPLAYIPPLNGLAAMRYTWPNNAYWLEMTLRWSLNKTRIDPSQERPAGGYGVLNIYAGADLGRFDSSLKGYRLTLGIENLANKTYVNPVTQANVAFPASITNPLVEPGRSVTINLVSSIGR